MRQPTSGTELVDELIDGVRIGDNLVFQADGSALLDLLVDRFTAQASGRVPVVVVRLAAPWQGPIPNGMTVLDWSPVITGITSTLEGALAPTATLDDALASLRTADQRVGTGAAFAFDRLSAVQRAWGNDAALQLFLSACPRLYHRRSLAVWPVERDRHRPTFLRRLAEITQVVVELADDGDAVTLTVHKADGRRSDVAGRTIRAEVVDGDLRAVTERASSRERLGTLIREQRLARDLSQVDVARRVGISPSALSQVERGVRGPSGDTLMRLWEVLGVPFGPIRSTEDGYRLARRSGRARTQLQDGLVGECLVAGPITGALWLLEVAPGATGDRAPFPDKAPETVTVLRGIIDLALGGRTETLQEGDAITVTDVTITGWANPSTTPTELLWAVHSR